MDDFQSYLKIDLDNLKHNIEEIRQLTDWTKLAAVVKANAYGLGSTTISRELELLGVDYLCVASLNEALELRNHHIYTPILIMGYVNDENLEELVINDIDLACYNIKQCQKLNDWARRHHKLANIHIKIDTGMSRLGYKVDEENLSKTLEEIKKMDRLSNIRLQGIFSHFSDADSADQTFTQLQYQRFVELIALLEQEDIFFPLKHISNDAGAMIHGYQMDMIRVGIGMYGYYSSDFVQYASRINLKPVASLHSTITYVKWLEAGEYVGYNNTYKTKKRTKVATVSIGYADGYPYGLGNKGEVLVKGQRAKIIGKVCMDQLMIDVTDIKDVRIKDMVVLFGEDQGEEVSIYQVAKNANTIAYEILTGISMRIPRVYYKDGKIVKVINYLSSDWFSR